MEKFVHKYLSYTYKLGLVSNNSKMLKLLDHDAIFSKENGNMVYGDALLKELVLLFFQDEVTIKRYVESWAQSLKKYKVELIWYWSQEVGIMPIAIKIAATSIANDLINIVPMNAPTGKLLYFDYKLPTETPDTNGRIYDRETFKDNIDRITAAQFVLMDDLNNPTQPISVSSRTAKGEEIERQSWFNRPK